MKKTEMYLIQNKKIDGLIDEIGSLDKTTTNADLLEKFDELSSAVEDLKQEKVYTQEELEVMYHSALYDSMVLTASENYIMEVMTTNSTFYGEGTLTSQTAGRHMDEDGNITLVSVYAHVEDLNNVEDITTIGKHYKITNDTDGYTLATYDFETGVTTSETKTKLSEVMPDGASSFAPMFLHMQFDIKGLISSGVSLGTGIVQSYSDVIYERNEIEENKVEYTIKFSVRMESTEIGIVMNYVTAKIMFEDGKIIHAETFSQDANANVTINEFTVEYGIDATVLDSLIPEGE